MWIDRAGLQQDCLMGFYLHGREALVMVYQGNQNSLGLVVVLVASHM